ncbi:MAG: NAD(P)-dependent oxidoreductase [Bacteriovorax sp.]|nr:NAD(P)-dependent oxidoreductase [Bacteriovorax sp.]
MKILVTGANGFVGTHLCLKLLDLGHTVYGLVRTPSKMVLAHDNFIMVQGDLNLPSLTWLNYLPTDLDACIHTAGLVHNMNTDDFFKVNTLGTKFLIESLKTKFSQKLKFILVSSLAAAGPVHFGEKKDETDIDFPVSDYGRSKKQGEEMLKVHAPKEWISSIVRPPMIIGPGDAAVLDIFKMVKDGFILLPGHDAKIKEYSFVCVFDLVETITKLVESDLSLFLYSANESVVQFQQLIEEIKNQLKRKWIIYIPLPLFIIKMLAICLSFIYKFIPHQLRLTPDKIYELEAEAWTCDSSLSRTALKQNYLYDLKQTIAVTLTDYRKRKWL